MISKPDPFRHSSPVAALLVAFALGGCTQSGTNAPAAGGVPVAGSVPEPSADAPAGKGCGPEIARFRSIIDYDVSVNRLARSVYGRATADLSQADTACAAGREVQARAILITTKRNYGYN